MFQLTTWNVLHRIHAVNWHEAPVGLFPDERVRIAGITDFIATHLLTSDTAAVCLQEVSGDQLDHLRKTLGEDRATIVTHEYPRVPKLREPVDEPPLTNEKEFLVTLVPRASRREVRVVEEATFDSDPGKGFLAVSLGGNELMVINTHVSAGGRRDKQLARLVRTAAKHSRVALLGDWNTEHALLAATLNALAEPNGIKPGGGAGARAGAGAAGAAAAGAGAGAGAAFTVTDLSHQPVTRVGSDAKPGHTIDHVVAKSPLQVEPGTVRDAAGLSDHQPVTARVFAK